MHLDQVLRDIEDRLVPQLRLDVWERVIYYHLLRHTRLDGIDERLFSIESLALSTGISDWKVRELVRSLHAKGCLVIQDRSRKGHLLRVLLPAEVSAVVLEGATEAPAPDIAAIDFFTGRKHLQAILRRETFRCFYCLREISADTCVLDHVAARAGGLDNSYRNIVASCHACNAAKQEAEAGDFLRALYRRGVLTSDDLQERLRVLELLRAGDLVPSLREGA